MFWGADACVDTELCLEICSPSVGIGAAWVPSSIVGWIARNSKSEDGTSAVCSSAKPKDSVEASLTLSGIGLGWCVFDDGKTRSPSMSPGTRKRGRYHGNLVAVTETWSRQQGRWDAFDNSRATPRNEGLEMGSVGKNRTKRR